MVVVAVANSPTLAARDFISLAKPKVIWPHSIILSAAMVLAGWSWMNPGLLLLTLTGGGLVAAAASTLNCYFDRDIDRMMERTASRPLPAGRLRPEAALAFGVLTGLCGLLVLVFLVNFATAAFAAVALLYYLAYTILLKRRSRWGVVIGSGAGAMTPLIGWAAAGQRFEIIPCLLAAMIILWTIPHFGALAITRQKDYRKAGLETWPGRADYAWMIASSLLLLAASLLIGRLAGLGAFYLGTAVVLGAGLLYLALRLKGRYALDIARWLYRYSIVYVALIFGTMVIDKLVFR